MKRPPAVISFGEILWDSLPGGLFVGGAPLNVAYHLLHRGADPRLASAVGRDWLGDELLRRLRGWGLGVDGIARIAGAPTGTVNASVEAGGEVRYVIAADVAWDRIPAGRPALAAAARARALVFGSLALRSEPNRSSLDRLLAALPAGAERVFDVNLRAPHDDLGLVRDLWRRATLIKLNADEAARLLGQKPGRGGREEAWAKAIAARSGAASVCVTAGARGAGLWRRGGWSWERGRPVAVADTVGAGDAFLASLVSDMLGGEVPARRMLARACRLGEWVASQPGATPEYPARRHQGRR